VSSLFKQHSARPVRRLLELDVLRGIAAFGVLVFHFTDYKDPVNVHPYPLPFRFGYGTLGVYLFFMISGFVIFAPSIQRIGRCRWSCCFTSPCSVCSGSAC
jgi:peptidoglycan/LPS O-acetylase OafA/YrhL